MRAKKSYGQHFLRHPDIARRIAYSLSSEDPDTNVLEIGPGKGILTQFVEERYPRFRAVDADPDMISFLEKAHPAWSSHLILGDFLQMDLRLLFDGQPFTLVGNFPYNISTQIVFKMLEHKDLIPELVGMFQKEVSKRIVSGPGNKDYGILSVLVQAWYEGEYLFSVSRESFDPPPKVQSGVIRLRRKANTGIGCNEEDFIRVVKTSFGQRRKMLRNTMKSLTSDMGLLEQPLFTKRPEQLSLEEFIDLTKMIYPVE